MLSTKRNRSIRQLAWGASLFLASNAAYGQQLPVVPDLPVQQSTVAAPAGSASIVDLKARVDRLEQQNQELIRALQDVKATPSQTGTAVPVALPTPPAPETAESSQTPSPSEKTLTTPALCEPKKSSSVDAKATYKNGLFLWIESPNKEYTMHLGGWMQYDGVFWNQSPDLRTPQGARSGPAQGVASGAPQGGIGNMQDGVYFRRIRIFAEGQIGQYGEYRLIPALENNQFSTIGLDEFWAGLRDVPILGSFRVGHVKNPIGLEADMTSSSRTMTFMERSAYSEAIELSQNFVSGIWWGNHVLDDRVAWQATLFRSSIAASGAFFGDGQWGTQARLTGIPIYEDKGNELLHLGVSGGWRNGSNNLANSPYRLFQSRARVEMRDDDPASTPAGAQSIPNASSARLIDTGAIAAKGLYLLGTETLMIHGPLSFQAEYGWQFLNGAYGVAPTGLTLNPAITPNQNYVFNGGYIQVAYTLTGETRGYDKRLGALSRAYYGPDGPFHSYGAWEVAARYSYVNLNDGFGANRIQGGTINGVSVALNWYLNNNFNMMFDWTYNERSNVPSNTIPGRVNGFGIEAQFQF
ncbi:MAG: porin [Gemmataceae bacterium]